MVETRAPERRGDPNVAVLLTWFLPGAGHVYLGRVATGALYFVVLEGLYFLGWWLTGGRTFEYLDPELQGPLATLLTPEAGNLGAMLMHIKVSAFGASEPLPFAPLAVYGYMLSALSGTFNLFAACHAHASARGVQRSGELHPFALLVAAWAVPGLGHWLQGRRLRAVIVFTLLVGLFALGTWFAAGTNLSRERHFYYWSGQFLLGLPAIVAELLGGAARVRSELPRLDVGLLYASMAGLLNVLAWLDVFGVAEERWRKPSSAPEGAVSA
ncbi:MAG: DUF6677 family protein [Planctomycetota bacterium]